MAPTLTAVPSPRTQSPATGEAAAKPSSDARAPGANEPSDKRPPGRDRAGSVASSDAKPTQTPATKEPSSSDVASSRVPGAAVETPLPVGPGGTSGRSDADAARPTSPAGTEGETASRSAAPSAPPRDEDWSAKGRVSTPIVAAPGAPPPTDRRGPTGAGAVRLRLEVDGAAERTTARDIERISGAVVSGSAVSVVLKLQNAEQVFTLKDGRFEGEVALQRGANQLHVVATDAQGREADVRLTVTYVPPPVPNGIAIIAPSAGSSLSPDDPPVVLVRGRVDDPAVSSIVLAANRARFSVPVRDGNFEHLVPVVEPVVHLVAETMRNGAPDKRSAPVTVGSAHGAAGVLFVDWGNNAPRAPTTLRAVWRGRADRLDSPNGVLTVSAVPGPAGSTVDAFYVRGLRPGVYTFLLDALQQGGRAPVGATLYLPLAGDAGIRRLVKVRPNPTGRTLIGKLLYPLGLSWDDDEWPHGRSESSDTITKFTADGVSWIERKGDLR